ncbi:MAG: tetratricopeptide repeat protein, partial [Planctomycetes bacterium]|nr:tetratricopeptide repeat protein [Planctomycetota bacterium]
DCSKAIELDSGLAIAWRNRGLAYLFKGEDDQAIKDYSKAIELDLDDADVWNDRGDAYTKLGNEAKPRPII